MPKYHVHTQRRVMHDIDCMTVEELQETYDIEIDDDGTVWDNCEGRLFENIHEWGLFIEQQEAEEEAYEYVVKPSGKRRLDDDY